MPSLTDLDPLITATPDKMVAVRDAFGVTLVIEPVLVGTSP